jgi:cold shock CspA family protein
MPVKIYEISKKLGLENKDVLAKARELGIVAAKVPSSSLDRITAEYLEEQLTVGKSVVAADPEKITTITPTPPMEGTSLTGKPQIAITATGAELYRLVERDINGEIQIRLEVAETEYSEPLRLCLVRDTNKKTLEVKPKLDLPARAEIGERTRNLLRAAYYASRLNTAEDWVNLAEYGNAVKKLDSTFQPQDFGERSLGSLLRRVTDLFELRNDEVNPIVYYLRMKDEKPQSDASALNSPSPSSQGHLPIIRLTSKMATGKIHNLKLGFGFIMPDDGSENLFFHATDVEGCTIFDLKPGDSVEYEPAMNEKGPCGQKVRRLV